MLKPCFITFRFVFSLVIAACVLFSCNPPRNATKAATPQQSNNESQHKPQTYPLIQQKFFTQPWTGTKWCNGDTKGENFELVITSKDSANVYIEGFSNSKLQVIGKIRGYLIIVEPQKITTSGNTVNVSGTLALSNDHNLLRGSFALDKGNQNDSCKVALALSKL